MKYAVLIALAVIVLFAECDAKFKLDLNPKKCKKSAITCPCGRHGQNITVPLHMCAVKDPVTGEKQCELCNKMLMDGDMCSRFDNCETCVKGLTVCATCPPDAHGDYCANKSSDQGIIVYPIVVRVPRGVPIHENRYVRRAKTCKYPPTMSTAEVECKIWPKEITCKEFCVFGHVLPNGNQSTEMSCDFDENVWKPNGFEECQPFVDCTTDLITAGTLNCTASTLKRGNRCKIECFATDNTPATEERVYECGANGKWKPKLPFCAKHGTGVKLVARPYSKE